MTTTTDYQFKALQAIYSKPCKSRRSGQVSSEWTGKTWFYVITIGLDDVLSIDIIKEDRTEVFSA